MKPLTIFENFAADFELCIKDDNWQRIGSYFADEAVYDNVGSGDQTICGRESILRFFQEDIANFDRKFDSRVVESTADVVTDGETLTRPWRSIYKKEGFKDLVLEGTSCYNFKDGKIQKLQCQLNPEYKSQFEQWFKQNGKRLLK